MQEEKEIKLEILKKELKVRELVEDIKKLFNFNSFKVEKIEDTYYDNQKNNLFLNNQALRIRKTKTKSFVAFKALFYLPERIKNPWFILEKEEELDISKKDLNEILDLSSIDYKVDSLENINLTKLKEIFKKCNLKESIIIKKIRYSFENEEVEIFVDKIDNLGIFIEIEAKKDILLEKYVNKITLNTKKIILGYTNLYAERVLKIEVPEFDKKYKTNPNWNYLGKQKEIVNKIISRN